MCFISLPIASYLHRISKLCLSIVYTNAELRAIEAHVHAQTESIIKMPCPQISDALAAAIVTLDHNKEQGKREWADQLGHLWKHHLPTQKAFEALLPQLRDADIAHLEQCKRKYDKLVSPARELPTAFVLRVHPPYREIFDMLISRRP